MTVTINQKRDKFPGVMFGDDIDSTYKKAWKKVLNPPRLNIYIPVKANEAKEFANAIDENSYKERKEIYFYKNGRYEEDSAKLSDNEKVLKLRNGDEISIENKLEEGYRYVRQFEDGGINQKILDKIYIYSKNLTKIIKKDGENETYLGTGYMVDNENYIYKPMEFLKKLNLLNISELEAYYSFYEENNALLELKIDKIKTIDNGKSYTLSNIKAIDVIKQLEKSHIVEYNWDYINRELKIEIISNIFKAPDIPEEVIGNFDGEEIKKSPITGWGGPGKGSYQKGVQKDADDRYLVAVGPKILNPNYSDRGKIQWGEFQDVNRNIDVYLKSKKAGDIKIIKCYVEDLKAHSYNKFPDEHPNDTGNKAFIDVESGLLQTGIAYPNSYNAKQNLPCSKNHFNGTIIEFCGHEVDFNINEYTLEKIIVYKK